jgi:hypothetical protein
LAGALPKQVSPLQLTAKLIQFELSLLLVLPQLLLDSGEAVRLLKLRLWALVHKSHKQ